MDLLHKFGKGKKKKEKPYLRAVACYYGGGVFVWG